MARVDRATRAWHLTRDGQGVGSVVRFGSRPRGFVFVVRNLHGQDVGMIDALGRAWRFEPPDGRPACIGSGTVAEGAGRILGWGTGVTLTEADVREEASSDPSSAAAFVPVPREPEPVEKMDDRS